MITRRTMIDTTVPPTPEGPWAERYAVRVRTGREPAPIAIRIDVARKAKQQRIWESNRRRGFV